jgi:hypothetical protein
LDRFRRWVWEWNVLPVIPLGLVLMPGPELYPAWVYLPGVVVLASYVGYVGWVVYRYTTRGDLPRVVRDKSGKAWRNIYY